MDSQTTTAGERLLDYSHSRLVAVLDARVDAQAVIDDLIHAGFTKSLDMVCGVEGARLIDFNGSHHGPLARLSHALHHLTVEGEYMHQYEEALKAGHCLVTVRTRNQGERERALELVLAHGGHFINQFAWWTVETVAP